MSFAEDTFLDRFERLEISPESFSHRDHVQVAFEAILRYEFVDACSRVASTIRTMATNAGAPQKYNATITVAFMGLIAERMTHGDHVDVESFLSSNPDVLSSDVLGTWYSKERLHCAEARSQFLLPDRTS